MLSKYILRRYFSTSTKLYNKTKNVIKKKNYYYSSAAASFSSSSSNVTDTNTNGKNSDNNNEQTTHFGFRDVEKNEKENLVRDVFDSVADNYDIMKDLMSGTLHRYWKNEFVNTLHPLPGMQIIDVAGGTGDIAFRMHDMIRKKARRDIIEKRGDINHNDDNVEKNNVNNSSNDKIIVCDINTEMLRVGEDRAVKRGYDVINHLNFIEGNAEKLPFDDDSFDAYTIAFGIRNVTNINNALSEANRVLKRGGRFLCLEFSRVENDVLRQVYDTYSFNVIPKVGEMVTKDRESYQYLVESIRKFPNQNKFETMIQNAGFKFVTHRNFTNGVVAMHSGFKL